MGKNNMGFFYGKLYNSCNRTFSVGNGEKFIGGTGPYHVINLNTPWCFSRRKKKFFSITRTIYSNSERSEQQTDRMLF